MDFNEGLEDIDRLRLEAATAPRNDPNALRAAASQRIERLLKDAVGYLTSHNAPSRVLLTERVDGYREVAVKQGLLGRRTKVLHLENKVQDSTICWVLQEHGWALTEHAEMIRILRQDFLQGGTGPVRKSPGCRPSEVLWHQWMDYRLPNQLSTNSIQLLQNPVREAGPHRVQELNTMAEFGAADWCSFGVDPRGQVLLLTSVRDGYYEVGYTAEALENYLLRSIEHIMIPRS